MSEITDEMLMAFADGQLAAADRCRVADYIATRPEARARVEMFQNTRAELGTLLNAALCEPVPDKLIAAINAAPMSRGSAPHKASASTKATRMSSFFDTIFPSWPTPVALGACAATLVIGAVIGLQWRSPQPTGINWQDIVALNEGRILAKDNFRDGLEKTPLGSQVTLNTRSSQIAFTPVMTFERKDGGFCRQYNLANSAGALIAGVGCRNSAGDWTVEVQSELSSRKIARGNQDPNKFEIAGALKSPIIDKAVDKMIRGNVLSKETEAQLLAGNWLAKSPK